MLDFFTFAHFKKSPSLLHAVTTKSNDLPYAFSLALHTGEEVEKIRANRNRLSDLLQSHEPLHFIVADQTHGDNIKLISQKERKE